MSDTPPTPPPALTPEEVEAAELNEFEQSFFDAIQSRFPASEGAGPTDAPDTAPELGVSAGEEPPVEGQEVPSPELSQPDAGASPDGGEAPGGEHGQSPSVFTLSGGQELSEDQIVQALQVHNYFARLSPDQVRGIDALMSGQYRLAPANDRTEPQPIQPVVSPGHSPSPPSPTEEGEWLDPSAQRAINRLQAEIDQLRQSTTASLTPVVQRQQDADYQQRLDIINAVSDNFQRTYELEDPQMRALEQAIVESQTLPALTHRYGSLQNGMQAALEMYFWSTPQLRDNHLAKQQSAAQADLAAQDAATLRKQQLTALSASGGSAPRREPVPSTPEDRHAAMTQEIAQAMNGSGTIQ